MPIRSLSGGPALISWSTYAYLDSLSNAPENGLLYTVAKRALTLPPVRLQELSKALERSKEQTSWLGIIYSFLSRKEGLPPGQGPGYGAHLSLSGPLQEFINRVSETPGRYGPWAVEAAEAASSLTSPKLIEDLEQRFKSTDPENWLDQLCAWHVESSVVA